MKTLTPDWESRLHEVLPTYGHRNWIVVADSAYPQQSATGIETTVTGGKQIDVLETVLKAIDDAPHVFAAVMVDQELEFVAEDDAPGITEYRDQLKALLEGKHTEVKPHEEIIGQLAEGSQLFNVLLLKSDMTIPYTTIFLRLECGYWDEAKENKLRASLQQ